MESGRRFAAGRCAAGNAPQTLMDRLKAFAPQRERESAAGANSPLNKTRCSGIVDLQTKQGGKTVMEIGKRIAAARTAAGITQQELADKLFVSRDLVAKWEQGRRRPDHGMIERIAEALNVKPDSIISRNECVFRELKSCIPNGADIPIEALSALISRFLRERPQKEADIFIRRYYLMNTPAEIAIRYGIGANQVRSRLSKTAKKLGEFLEAECEGKYKKEERKNEGY